MQSHQKAFPMYQPEKHLGHRRRPSIGKSMPVTSLLLNFPPPPSEIKNYGSLSRDGLSPELEKPPTLFQLNEVNDERRSEESSDDNVEQDYEILISDSSDIEEEDKESEKCSLVGNMESSPVTVTTTMMMMMMPCSVCLNGNKKNTEETENPTLSELCKKLCDEKCKDSKNWEMNDLGDGKCDIISDSSSNTKMIVQESEKENPLKVPLPTLTIEEQRRIFLNEMLENTEKNNNNNNNDTLTYHDNSHHLMNNCNDLLKPEIIPRGFNVADFNEKYTIAEALAKTSMMTSPAAKRRLAARKIEWEQFDGGNINNNTMAIGYAGNEGPGKEKEFIPPRELLLYLVRMGSFNSAPKINNPDTQDDTFEIPQGLSTNDLLRHCDLMRGENLPKLLARNFYKPAFLHSSISISNEITEGLRVLELNAVSKACSPSLTSPKHLRVLQWNILSQSLGQHNDNFVCCPDEALLWDNRKYLIIEEILKNNPDIICLQEVDHFKFLERVLGSQRYAGVFFPKPDSPCLYIEENNGPDGCAIFYKQDKFDLINFQTRILEVWRVQSNQVAIAVNFKIHETGRELCVCTTHLKARNGALLSKLRNEQGKDLLRFANSVAQGRPLILCGDFNAEPIEPVYSTILNSKELNLSSAYADIHSIKDGKMKTENSEKETRKYSKNHEYEENRLDVVEKEEGMKKRTEEEEEKEDSNHLTKIDILASREPPYTTWKIREEGEVCHTIDYIFYSKDHYKVNNCLMFPKEDEIGENRTPSLQYPSDHFSLVCDFEIIDEEKNNEDNKH